METRNIIKSGPSSYVVSLPMGWVRKNKLKKGDPLFMEEHDNKISYSSGEEAEEESKSLTINVDGRSDENIVKVLKSAYLTNYNIFTLHGDSIKDRAAAFREMLHQLVAVEIMEQTSSKIVAHEMLDKKKNSPEKIIRRMDMILRGIFEDIGLSIGNKSSPANVSDRELDLNRLHLLAQRLVINALGTPSYALELKKSNFEILMEFKMIGFLEMIGDSLKECSKVSHTIRQFDAFNSLSEKYLDVISAYYKNEPAQAIHISISIPALEKSLDKGMQKADHTPWVEFIMPLKEIALLIDEIALVVLNKNT